MKRKMIFSSVLAAVAVASGGWPSIASGSEAHGESPNHVALVEKRAAPHEWLFPTGDETPHEGMAFADGVTGVLAWGGGDTLKLTVSRADLWDHRGGYTWTDAQSYTNITDAILKGDKERLLDLFKKETPRGVPRNPFMLPLGRVEVKIPCATLRRGTLDVKTGVGVIEFDFGGKTCRAELAMSKASRAFALKLPDGIAFEARAIHSMEFPSVKKRLAPIGHKPAKYTKSGFTWELPADESVTLAFAKRGGELMIGTWRGNVSRRDAEAQSSPSLFLCDSAALREISFASVRAESEAYWAKFWREGARVKVPDPVIQGLFDYGMYRFGAMTDPDGVPAGLQGPWIEDNDLPPWGGDYHFNINVQECYAPAYRGGHFANMMPLFRMICSWKPVLRENARKFAGVDGYVLPHSVSDRGVNIGGYWTGTIDHGSTAWVADMMWRYVKYSRDVDFLRRDAYDFMKGAMNVYRAMMTEDASGALAIPTGPSPEWGGSDFDKAVGRNPSFQLAVAHRLARDLVAAAAMLGEKPDPMWLDVEKRLPLASIDDAKGGILLFENRPLSDSHRHHSHMAGLFPFDVFDLSDAATAATVEKTYAHWRMKGTSQWTGWCVPWAAVLETHLGNAPASVELLHAWDEYFTNPGHASIINPWKPGFGRYGKPRRIGKDGRAEGREIMQTDGQCAFAAAVLEMMAHEVNGKTEFFRGCPPEWKDVSFENIALSDGRRACGRRLDGRATVEVSGAGEEIVFAPDGSRDRTGEVLSAVKSGATVRFAKGEYHFRSPAKLAYYISNHNNSQPHDVFLPVTNVADLAILGDGAVFVFHGSGVGMTLMDTRHVTVRGVAFDYEFPAFSEARLEGFDGTDALLRIDCGKYPMVVEDGKLTGVGDRRRHIPNLASFFDGETHASMASFYIKPDADDLGGGLFRIRDGRMKARGIRPGSIVMLRGGPRPSPCVSLCRAHDSLFEDCAVLAGDGMGFIAQRCENVTVRGSVQEPSAQKAGSFAWPGSGRVLSLQADATHFSNCKGRVLVENCLFEGMVDDAINVHSTCLRIESIPAPDTLVCRYMHNQSTGFEVFLPDERLRFIKAATLENGAETVVKDAKMTDALHVTLRLADSVPSCYAPGDAVENADWQPSVTFRNNIVRNSYPRGALFTTPGKVVCEGNLFDHVPGQVIQLEGDASGWFESGGCRDVTIRGNVFRHCSYMSGEGIIQIRPNMKDVKSQKERYHRNILIEGNRFETFRRPLLRARSVQGLVWRDNDVIYGIDRPPLGNEPFVIDYSEEIDIKLPPLLPTYGKENDGRRSLSALGSDTGRAACAAAVALGAANPVFADLPALVPIPREIKDSDGECIAKGAPTVEIDKTIPSEGYVLSVSPQGVTIRHSDAAGLFYAKMTLRQLEVRRDKNGTAYPCVEIKDAPRYRWRGVHIDDCRHFFGKEKVKRVMDLMAQHKMNRLHWHLTDDQGWRLDIPGYPELVKHSAARAASPRHGTRPILRMTKDWSKDLNGEKYGPFFYTEADVREMVAYAAERHIAIVPEIELPGHVYAALAAYPEFACNPENMKGKGPLCIWGIERDVLCVGNDKAVKFMEDVLDYVCRLFPGDVIHIGGDECPTVRWKTCPKCRARIEAEGLKAEKDLQPWFTRRFLKFIEARGKRVVGWDEYLRGDVPKSAIGMIWQAGGGGSGHKFLTPLECVTRGHDLVMSPQSHCYFDYGQGLENDPFQYFGRRITLEKVYSFDPCEGIPPELRGHIIGGQCNNWSEWTWNEYDLDWKMWPRACALAEVLWTGEERPGFDDFKRRMVSHRRRLVSQGVNCAPLE